MIVDATNNIVGGQLKPVTNQDIGGGATPPTMPRQEGSGTVRGNRTIVGNEILLDPQTGKRTILLNGGDGSQTFYRGKDSTKALVIDNDGTQTFYRNDGTSPAIVISDGGTQTFYRSDGKSPAIVIDNDGTETFYRENGTSPAIIIDNDGTETFYDTDGVTPRFFTGRNSSGKWVSRLSKDGKNAVTGGISDMIWSSEFNNFKIAQTGTASINVSGTPGSGLGTVSHDIGYPPVVFAFVTEIGGATSDLLMLPYYSIEQSISSPYPITIGAAATVQPFDTNITFYVRANNNPSFLGQWSFRYYILVETAA